MKIKSTLNQRAQQMCQFLCQLQEELHITVEQNESGTMLLDFGVNAFGGLRAGAHLAEVCLAGLAEVKLTHGVAGSQVDIYTDHPVAACMASQYAGWQVSVGDYFAMGSGPMRCAANSEPLMQDIDFGEAATHAVGVLEAAQLPNDEVCAKLAADCNLPPSELTLCIAPTASIAGTVQVVARTVETTLHKMHELGFDIKQVRSGHGSAPLPPVAANDLVGIGRTNDAILYGGRVTLWVHAEDDELNELVAKIPSQASRDFGVPFGEIFKRYDGDFYKIDPHLFSPAVVSLVNLKSGRAFQAGEIRADILQQSFSS